MPTSRDSDSRDSDSRDSDSRDSDSRDRDSSITDIATALSGTTDADVEATVTIDCDCCALRNTNACDDCVVSFLLDREPEDAVVIDADEARAMRMLERAGLVPTLRFSSRAG
jgi:hypothetical protein